MKTVLVCGDRHFTNVPLLWRTLDGIAQEFGIKRIIEGASDDVTGPHIGADYWAHQWARASDIATIRVHADWKVNGKAAGPIRNQAMLNEKPDMIIAFSGGRGTADMIDRAKKQGFKVLEIKG